MYDFGESWHNSFLNFKGVGVTLEVRLHRFMLKKEAEKKVESRRREPHWVRDRQVGHP